jgi:hypothetical protein
MTLFLIVLGIALVLSLVAYKMDQQHYTRTHAGLLIVVTLSALACWVLDAIVLVLLVVRWLGMNDTKPKIKSKILWANGLAIVVAGLAAAEPVLGLLKGVLPEHVYMGLAFGMPIVNAILRKFTSQALA